ncbi:hydroxylamine reductase [Burkholderia ubonensis]|uniref:hydroxylamine reductase n=1 Tax=Burkholderia ubonensis TaxID=101571 RepID=UPI0007548574|nr:hydroxylamine reductase [Burkholderia ubonensis]KVU15935.1 hydroxylamine reductase [Burkholderia ubonensis]
MFCDQCEQTDRTGARPGCASAKGNCGKDATTADLQDLLVHAAKGIAQYGALARGMGEPDRESDRFVLYAMFTTLTNVNFHAARFVTLLREAAQIRDRVKGVCEAVARDTGTVLPTLSGPATWQPAAELAGMLEQAANVGIEAALDFLAHDPADVDALLAKALELGRLNLKVMELLDSANTGRFGAQQPTSVRVTPVAGKAILVSGHDLGDLHALLEQTAGTGIQVYTHGEMLPAHAYPTLKAFPHLAGNYGGAWQDQQSDFAHFPGPILMTSNCIIEPLPQYRQRIFTTGPVGWPGVRHLEHHDFSTLIQAARALPGFPATAPEETITVGFGRHAVLGVADKVIDAVKAGQIRHFFLIGGCDGAAPGRNYYTEFAEQAPGDTVVMTLGCNKYRFNRHAFGDIGGIPRLLDIGQCNDSYSAIRIATALADAFECGVNDLPLSLVISWFEQKAAAVLLTLLALGLRNIRLGPTLPAFLTPGVLDVLVEQFGIQPIGEAGADLAASLSRQAA